MKPNEMKKHIEKLKMDRKLLWMARIEKM
jgi:hypothetical protein